MLLLEEYETAKARGAVIYGEICGFGSSIVADKELVGDLETALTYAMENALQDAGVSVSEVGHLNAHGLGTLDSDSAEARAIRNLFGEATETLPIIAMKSYFGNLGAGSGAVEVIASLLSFKNETLPKMINYQTPDPACPVNLVHDNKTSPAGSVLAINVTPQGQAVAIYITDVKA